MLPDGGPSRAQRRPPLLHGSDRPTHVEAFERDAGEKIAAQPPLVFLNDAFLFFSVLAVFAMNALNCLP